MKQIFTLISCLLFLGTMQLDAQNNRSPLSSSDWGIRANKKGFEPIRCYTVEREAARRAQNPNLPTDDQFEQWIQKERVKLDGSNKRAAILTIPIIFHIIHNGEGVGTGPNISATYVNAQIEQLNNDFRRISGTSGFNTNAVGADSEIEFCAATLDESGATLAEPGINRIDWTAQNDPYSAAYFDASIKGATQWDPTLYMNFWSADLSGGLLGWAQFPEAATLGGIGTGNGAANTDGVVCLYSSIGSSTTPFPGGAPYDEGRTATHEVGHWLGLRHIWGDSNCGTDFCNDTPTQQTSSSGCPNTTTCDGVNDMVENYMDYSYDACMNVFTVDQKARMRIVMGDTGLGSLRREILASSDRCGVPTPRVNFVSSATNAQIEGTSCNTRNIAIDVTLSMNPSSATTVSFASSSIATATMGEDYSLSTSSMSFSAAGTQTVNIIIEEDAVVETDETIIIDMTVSGSDAIEGSTNQVAFTLVDDDNDPTSGSGGITTIWTEGFEAAIPDWFLIDNSGQASRNSWTTYDGTADPCGDRILTTTIATVYDDDNGTPYCDYYNYGYTSDAVLFRSVDATLYTSITVDFDWSCAGRAGTDYGSFVYSTDGGTTWIAVGAELSGSTVANTVTNLALPATLDNTIFDIGWRWTDNGNNQRTQPPLQVDNIVVKGTSQGNTIQTSGNTGAGYADHILGPNQTVHFFDQANGNIMATIENLSVHNYGCTRVEVDRTSDGTTGSFTSPNGDREDIADKTFIVDPEFPNASGDYKITLYYTKDEIDRWVATNLNGEGLADLEMIKYSGASPAISTAPSYEIALDGQGAFGTDYTFTATWATGFSGFGLGDTPPPVPVEMISFDATPNRSSIDLAWATASERNNKGFDVQRSLNPRDGFQTIGWIDGFGNTSNRQDYTFTDEAVRENVTYYYRLNQTDFDGTTAFSEIATAQIVGKGLDVSIVPNPAKNAAVIYLSGELAKNLNVTVMDIQGRTILTKTIADGSTQVDLDVNSLASGVYMVRISSPTVNVVKKLLID